MQLACQYSMSLYIEAVREGVGRLQFHALMHPSFFLSFFHPLRLSMINGEADKDVLISYYVFYVT